MALIKCDECGREISDRSAFCPGCGYPTHLNKALADDAAKEADATGIAPTRESSDDTQPPVGADVSREKPLHEFLDDDVESLPVEDADDMSPEEREQKNRRNKVILFIAVFAVLLVIVSGLYYYEDYRVSHADETEAVADDTADTATVVPVETDTIGGQNDSIVPVAPVVVKKIAPVKAEEAAVVEEETPVSPPAPAPATPAPAPEPVHASPDVPVRTSEPAVTGSDLAG